MGHFFSSYLSDLIGRFDGPLHFRLIAQPLMATFLAVRHGIQDARVGRSAYGWAVLTDPAHRRYLLESGWKDLSKLLIMAYAMDVVYQLLVWRGLKPFEALSTALILAVIPYLLLRGPVNRLLRLGQTHSKSSLSATGQEQKAERPK